MPEQDAVLYEATKSFERNIRAMRVFFQRFGGAASEYDREAVEKFTTTMKNILPDTLFTDRDGQSGTGSNLDEKRELTNEQEEQIREAMRKPGALPKLFDAASALGKAAPRQSAILLES